MIVNFKAHEISRGTRKLVQISTLIKKKKKEKKINETFHVLDTIW